VEKRITVGLFDDHPVVLDASVRALKEHAELAEVLFSTSSKEALLQLVKENVPQVMILDIISADVTALELFEYFRAHHPQTALIAYSSLSSPILVENLLFLGVKGFVNKRQPLEDMLSAVFLIADGHISVPEDYRYLTSRFNPAATAILSEREIGIVNLVAEEFTSFEIAEKLNLSVNTIENHRKRIFLKLNVKNSAGMVMVASQLAYIKGRG
jgi:DNA-binding NarL/FixJ family response regulator